MNIDNNAIYYYMLNMYAHLSIIQSFGKIFVHVWY